MPPTERPVRYIFYGAGAVGGTIGARLFETGADVVLVARGEHGRAIAARGLQFGTPDGWRTLPIPVVAHPRELTFAPGDVVVLSMKSQDTTDALRTLVPLAGSEIPVVCAQNGVANERRALRRFAHVHGMCVQMPAVHIDPGVVRVHSAAPVGTCDVGRFPRGRDDLDTRIAADFEAASIRSAAVDDIMARKYGKLISNLTNVLEAACGRDALGAPLAERARAEAAMVFAAAGIVADRGAGAAAPAFRIAPVAGAQREGGSTTQSLARGKDSLEIDDINGEIVLLGRVHGVPTPVNAMLQSLAIRLIAEHVAPGGIALTELERALDAPV
jgi:2-dehydropantoate 2-reductase